MRIVFLIALLLLLPGITSLAKGVTGQVTVLFVINHAESNSERIESLGRMCLDSKRGELYVIEPAEKQILIFSTSDGRFITRIPTPKEIAAPVAMALDTAGNLYLSDEKQPRVLCMDYRGKVIAEISLTGIGENEETVLAGHLAVDSKGVLYAVDRKRRLVFAFNSINGRYLRRFGGLGKETGKFDEITDLTVGSDDRLYITDSMAGKITIYDSGGKYQKRFGITGDATLSLINPTGVTIDNKGQTYVVDSIRHTVIAHNTAGDPIFEFCTLGRAVGYLYFPRQVLWDPSNTFFISEPFMNRIQAVQVTPPT